MVLRVWVLRDIVLLMNMWPGAEQAAQGDAKAERRFYRPPSYAPWPVDMPLSAELRRVFARRSLPIYGWKQRIAQSGTVITCITPPSRTAANC